MLNECHRHPEGLHYKLVSNRNHRGSLLQPQNVNERFASSDEQINNMAYSFFFTKTLFYICPEYLTKQQSINFRFT